MCFAAGVMPDQQAFKLRPEIDQRQVPEAGHGFRVAAGDAVRREPVGVREDQRPAVPHPLIVAPPPAVDGEFDDRARYRTIAERRVRLALILSEIGRANNIQVSEDELNRAMMEQARMMPDRAAQVFEFYRDNPDAMQSLQAPIFEDKVVDFVIEMAQVTDRAVELDELTAEPADGDAAPEEGQDG